MQTTKSLVVHPTWSFPLLWCPPEWVLEWVPPIAHLVMTRLLEAVVHTPAPCSGWRLHVFLLIIVHSPTDRLAILKGRIKA